MNYGKLTPAEHERLAWLQEECSEVIQAASKIMRHGYDSFDPTDNTHPGNRHDLEREISDVLKAISLLISKNDISLLIEYTPQCKMKYAHCKENMI